MATDICLPVAKFSHAAGLRPDNTIPWAHIVASNIFVILTGDSVHIPAGKISMRIVQGTTVLENVDLGGYIDQTSVMQSNMLRNGTPQLLENLPIFGLIKDTALAIRYRPEDQQPHRIQLRMHSVSDCHQIFDVLHRRGLEFRDRNLVTSHSGVSYPCADSSSSHTRLFTADSHSDNRRDVVRSGITDPPHLHASQEGSFSQPPTTSVMPVHANSITSVVHGAAHPVRISRDESLAPRSPFPTPGVGDDLRSFYLRPGQTILPAVMPNVETVTNNRLLTEQPTSVARHLTSYDLMTQQTSSSGGRSKNPGFNSPGPISSRPRTSLSATSAPTGCSGTLEYEVPPRRELPFKQPNDRHGDPHRSTSRPSSSIMSMPPLPKPKLARNSTTPYSRAKHMLVRRDEAQSTLGGTPSLREEPRSSISEQSSLRGALPMNELLYGTGERSRMLPRTALQQDTSAEKDSCANGNINQPQASDGQLEARTGESNSQPVPDPDWLKRVHATLLENVRGTDVAALGSFANQSHEDRRAALDAFMIDKLKDPNFITLCEDVENCWRRIGFG